MRHVLLRQRVYGCALMLIDVVASNILPSLRRARYAARAYVARYARYYARHELPQV